MWTDSQARMARLQGNYGRAVEQRDAWAKCANCGSTKVRTVSSRGFTPTGMVAAPAAIDPLAKRALPHVSTSSSGAGNFCPSCGGPTSVGSRFCSNCGSPLSGRSSQPEAGEVEPVAAPQTNEGLHPRLTFLHAEAAAKVAGDRGRLKALRNAEKERQAQLRLRDLFAETKYDVQFAQQAKGRE